MKYIWKATACAASLVVAATTFAACSPNTDGDTQTTTTPVETQPTVTTTTTQHGSLAASDVIVRSGPGLEYDAIGGITYNEEIVILGREGDWYRIQFGDQVGYISAQYVDVDGEPNTSEMVESLKTTKTTVKTTTTKKATTTTKKGETTTTKKGATTTTKKGDTTAANGDTQTTTATNAVTTTTDGNAVEIVTGIPETVFVDDFEW